MTAEDREGELLGHRSVVDCEGSQVSSLPVLTILEQGAPFVNKSGVLHSSHLAFLLTASHSFCCPGLAEAEGEKKVLTKHSS